MLLFPKLTGSTFGRENGGGSHLDANMAQKATAPKPLGVLPPKMSPFGVPK
jgi:hypothetical protein